MLQMIALRSIAFTTLLFISIGLSAQIVTTPPSGGNQKATVTQHMGLVTAYIHYSSPDVTGPNGQSREGHIWGELVPFGMQNLGFGTAEKSPWRAGANENTIFAVSHDVLIEGRPLPAGEYGFHIIVREEGEPWTLIFNKEHEAWGSYFYKPELDVLRVDVKPKSSDFQEWLTYGFEDRLQNSCTAFLAWENKKVAWRIEVPNGNDLYFTQISKELQGPAGFNWQGWQQAAQFCVANKTHLEEALVFAEKSITLPFIGQENFSTLATKAQVLMALEKDDEAAETITKAIKQPGAQVGQIHMMGRQLLGMGKKEKAMEVFEYNAKAHPNTWPVNIGLARGYSAMGNFKKALKHAELAQKNVPEGDSLNANSVAAMIEKLKKKEDIN